ncbi:MAG TPA: WD40 repeat domain-containing serine/threonine-protein kinase [Vicinamibacterales bacterium]
MLPTASSQTMPMEPLCQTCGAPLAPADDGRLRCPACLLLIGLSDPAPDLVDDVPPRAASTEIDIGPYRVLRRLGEGGMGEVFLAEQQHPIRRTVAVKVLKPGAIDRQGAARFEFERQALAILNHQAIAKVFDAGFADGGRPYLAMEYVPGAWLTKFADDERLDIDERLVLFAEVCDGVHHAHQKGIIHRDLKPSNILAMRQDDRIVVKIIDFGIAKVLGPKLTDDSLYTQQGVVLGTPEYMSPEQAGFSVAQVDARTDLYALGLILYELLSGVLPFDREQLREVGLAGLYKVIRHDEPPRLSARVQSLGERVEGVARQRRTDPRSLVRRLRGDLEWITTRALEKDPARRYASASELAADVRRHLANEAIIAGPPSATYRLRKAVHRHRAAFAAAALVFIAVTVGAIVAATQWLRAERARADGRRQLVASLVATGVKKIEDHDTAAGLVWLVRALALEEEASRIESHRARIAYALAGMPRLVRLWRHESGVAAIAMTSDGLVASGSWDGVVRLWSLPTSEQIGTDLKRGADISSVSFSPDGARLAAASLDGSVVVWALPERRVVIEAHHGAGEADAAFSPDGSHLATGGMDGVVRLWRVDSGRVESELHANGPTGKLVFSPDGGRLAVPVLTQGVRIFDLNRPDLNRPDLNPPNSNPPRRFIPCSQTSSLHVVAFTPSRGIAVPCGPVQLWNVETGERIGPSMESGQPALSARISSDGTRLVVSGNDASVRLYDVATGNAAAPPLVSNSIGGSARFSADGQRVVSCATGGEVQVWTARGERASPLLPHGGACVVAMFGQSDRLLVTASTDGFVRVWDLASMETPLPLVDAADTVDQAVFSPDGKRLATGAGLYTGPGHGQVRVWDRATGAPVTPPMDAGGRPWSVVFSPDGSLVAVGTAGVASSSTRVWNAKTGEPVTDPAGDGQIRHQTFSPDGTIVAATVDRSSLGLPGQVLVRRVATGERLYPPLDAPGSPTAIGISADGRRLLAASDNPVGLQLWDLQSGRRVAVANHPSGVRYAFFMRDGRIFSIGGDQRGRMWSANLEPLGVSTTYGGSMNKGELSPDGYRVVASAESGEIRIHDLRSPDSPLGVMKHQGLVYETRFSPDGRWIATAGFDQTARLWDGWTGAAITPPLRNRSLVWHAMFAPGSDAWSYAGFGAFIQPLRSEPRPADVLTLLAELHAGRTVSTAGQEIPLVPDDLFDRWRRFHSKPPPFEDAPLHWLRARAYDSSSTKNWRGVIEALEQARRRGPLPWADTMRLLNAYGAVGNWQAARALIRELGAPLHSAPELAHVEAIASVHLGESARATELCRTLIDQHAATRNPDLAATVVRVCLLTASREQLPWATLADLASRAPVVTGDYMRRCGLMGAALVAAGRLGEGSKLLTEACSQDGGLVNAHTLVFALEGARRSGNARDASRWSAELSTAMSASSRWRARIMRKPLGVWEVAEIEALQRSRRD